MKTILLLLFSISLIIFYLTACNEDNLPKFNPPADHTLSIADRYHKPDFKSPFGTGNCTSCHGSSLTGGFSTADGRSTPSCYTCHGQLW
ncbi:MAG TPA: hypothetical protein ENI73_07935 [Spirochaetes bacterium]|mgnify:CR=1 FL=1|nr:hypothetical protein [Spirochaetota bacterium]